MAEIINSSNGEKYDRFKETFEENIYGNYVEIPPNGYESAGEFRFFCSTNWEKKKMHYSRRPLNDAKVKHVEVVEVMIGWRKVSQQCITFPRIGDGKIDDHEWGSYSRKFHFEIS